MTYIRFFPVLLALFLASTFAQEGFSRNITVAHDNKMLTFRCAGVIGSSSVDITLLPRAFGDPTVLKQQLEDLDDCSQASWVTEKMGQADSSTLVLLNPGRSGLNAQYTAFLVTDDSVTLAGYLPVSAEKVSASEYRSYSSEAGSVWERTDSLRGGKFRMTNELRLIISGSVCTNKAGKILTQEPCSATQVAARPGKPICVRYRSHWGQLLPASTCARLTEKM
jgi:hypothetical protein